MRGFHELPRYETSHAAAEHVNCWSFDQAAPFLWVLGKKDGGRMPRCPSVAKRDPGELPRARRFQALETLFFWQAADASIIKGATDDSEQGLSPHPFWKDGDTEAVPPSVFWMH